MTLYNPKTAQQRKYYWAVLLPESIKVFTYFDMEMDINQAHDFWKMMFLSTMKLVKIFPDQPSVERYYTKSTEDLSTLECAEYFDKIISYCGDFKISIPLADPNWKNN